tara:strand:+ start:985 stop:1431 length:447 start_codon:yes stop_codon:yes gene_type:complete
MSKIYKLLLLISFAGTSVSAVPVVPTFSTGTLNSRQETKTVVTETITSVDYRSGYEYVVSGHNIEPLDTSVISPKAAIGTPQTVDNITFTWTSVDVTPANKPDWAIKTAGEAFSFTETLTQPSLQNITTINRTTTTDSIVESVSVFTQ